MFILPKWVIPDHNPAYFEHESATAIEMVAKLYGSMQSFVEEYNEFSERVEKTVNDYYNGTFEDLEAYKTTLRQEFQDFIDVIRLRYLQQDNKINEAYQIMVDNLEQYVIETITDMKDSGELAEAILVAFNDLGERLTAEIEARTREIEDLRTELNNSITAERQAWGLAVREEREARTAAIEAEANARAEDIAAEQNARAAAITAEEDARIFADNREREDRELSDQILDEKIKNSRHKKILDAKRVYVDIVNGSDDNPGTKEEPFKTLDRFFEIANSSFDGSTDIRCFILSPGIYEIGAEEVHHVFSHLTIHICGGETDNDPIPGVVVRFNTAEEIKFYGLHVNLQHLDIDTPNTDGIHVDGCSFWFANCKFRQKLHIALAWGTLVSCTMPHLETSLAMVNISGNTITNTDPTISAYKFSNSKVRMYGEFIHASLESTPENNAFVHGISSEIVIQFVPPVKDINYRYGVGGDNNLVFITHGRYMALKNNFGNGEDGLNPAHMTMYATETAITAFNANA